LALRTRKRRLISDHLLRVEFARPRGGLFFEQTAMDLTGYGYKRSALRQQIPQITTGATPGKTKPSAQLSGEALRLLVKLDAKVALQELSARFPRVLNRIADAWHNPLQADRCFDELLLHSRGVRQGFPPAVISEIASLRHHYLSCMFPRRVDPWERAMLR
jgi:hypothetical protein